MQGGGEVQLSCPVAKQLPPINMTQEGQPVPLFTACPCISIHTCASHHSQVNEESNCENPIPCFFVSLCCHKDWLHASVSSASATPASCQPVNIKLELSQG